MITWFAGREPGATAIWWSPYQKIVVTERGPDESDGDAAERYFMTVNNTRYQGMLDLSEANVAANPGKFPVSMRGLSQYDLPYLLHPGTTSALIVGAGTGNDAAGAARGCRADHGRRDRPRDHRPREAVSSRASV